MNTQLQRLLCVLVVLSSLWTCYAISIPISEKVAIRAYPLESTASAARSSVQHANPLPPTGLSKDNYLDTISGIVGYFRGYQQGDGCIVDPVVKTEIQYSTPTFAHASAVLYVARGDPVALKTSISALECSLRELISNTVPQDHTNFFTLPIMLTIETLQSAVNASVYDAWMAAAAKINTAYYINLTTNWAIVAAGGEFIRYLHGLTSLDWVEGIIKGLLPQFDDNGMFLDPTPITNPPMPYDIFPRHYLEVMLARGYNGTYAANITELMRRGAWSSLLMQSPWGELPTGGRSSQHQWNEAVQCVVFELRANIFKKQGDMLSASIYKRAAHIAHKSMQRWIKPTGELFIIKNRFDPSLRFGFQDYSFVSNYNNLPASMLAMAYTFADDTITELPSFAEVGGFAFEVPSHHKIFANAGGNYLQIETCADPEYDSTGLTRVHHPLVDPLVGPTAGAPIQSKPRAIGLGWTNNGVTELLANFATNNITRWSLVVQQAVPNLVQISVVYYLNNSKAGVKRVSEEYLITVDNVQVHASVDATVDALSINFPAFLYDGQYNTTVNVNNNVASVSLNGKSQIYTIADYLRLQFVNDQVASRNGYMGIFTSSVTGVGQITYNISPANSTTY